MIRAGNDRQQQPKCSASKTSSELVLTMRRAFLSTCVHSYGVCTQAYRFPADFRQSCAAPMLAAHTQASGVNPVGNATAHGPSSTQKGFDSQSAGSKGKRTSRWRIVVCLVYVLSASSGRLAMLTGGQLSMIGDLCPIRSKPE